MKQTKKKINKQESGLWTDLHIKYNEDLTSDEKFIISEIVSLHKKGGCFKSNKAFSKLINKTERTVKRCIRELKVKGYLVDKNNLVFDNPVNVSKRYLVPSKLALSGNKNTVKSKFSSVNKTTVEKVVIEKPLITLKSAKANFEKNGSEGLTEDESTLLFNSLGI